MILKRRAKVAAGAAPLAVILAGLVLHTPWAQRIVLDGLSGYLGASEGIELKAERLSYNLLTLSVELRGVRVSATQAPDLPVLLELRLAQADVRWAALLRGRLVVNRVSLQGPVVRIVRDEKGRDNLPVLKEREPAADPNAPLGFVIARLDAEGASFQYEDRQTGVKVDVPRWRARIDGDVASVSHAVHLEADGGQVGFEGREEELRELGLDVLLSAGRVDMKKLRLVAGVAELDASGTVRDFARPSVEGQLRAGADLKRLVALAGVQERIEGGVRAQASIEGPLAGPRVAGRLMGTGLGWRAHQGMTLDAAAEWDGAADRVRLESLQLTGPAGRVEARGTVSLKEDGSSRVELRASNLDLGRIMHAEGLALRIAGQVAVTASAGWTGRQVERAEGRAGIRIKPTRGAPEKGLAPLEGDLTLTAGGGRLRLELASLRALGTRWEGEVALAGLKDLGGQLRGTIEDTGQVVSELEHVLGREAGTLLGVPVGGRVELTSDLSGSVERPRATAEIRGTALAAGIVKDVLLEARAAYAQDEARLDTLLVRWQGQELRASAAVGLESGPAPVRASVEVNDASLAGILGGLGQELRVEGRLNLKATAGGTLERLEARIDLAADGLKAYGEEWGRLAVRAGLQGERAVLDELHLEKPVPEGESGHLRMQGEYDLAAGSYRVRSATERLTLQHFAPAPDMMIRGRLDLNVQGEGTIKDPSLQAGLSVEEVKLGPRLATGLEAGVRVAGGEAVVECRLPQLRIAWKGRSGIRAPYRSEFAAEADETDLSLLGIEIGEETLAGRLSAALQGGAELSDAKTLRVDALVKKLQVLVRGQEIHNEDPLAFGLRDQAIRIERARLKLGDSALELNGALPLGPAAPPAGPLRLEAGIELADVLKMTQPQPGFSAQGRLGLEASVGGHLEKLDPSLKLSLRDAVVTRPELKQPVTGIALEAGYARGAVEIGRLAAKLGPGELAGRGSLPVSDLLKDLPLETGAAAGPAKFSMSLRGFDLQVLDAMPEQIGGQVSLRLEAEVEDPRELKTARAKAVFEQLELKLPEYGQYELRQEGESSVSLQDAKVTIGRLMMSGPKTRIEARGTAELLGERALDLRLAGSLDVGLLGLVAKGVQASGESAFELALTGAAEQPQASGFLEIRKGQASVPAARLAAENLDLRVGLTPERVTIERFSGRLNGGILSAGGFAGYSGTELKEIRVDAALKDAFFQVPEGLKTRASAEVRLRSREQEVELGGEVQVWEGSYREPLTLEGGLLDFLQQGKQVELTEERNPFLSSLRYNLGLKTVGPLVVDNNLAKVAMEADLRLVGTYYRPSVVGRVALEDGGELYLNEKTYVVERGTVSLVNEVKIEPFVDMLARTKASIYEIDLKLSGGPDDLEATFSSEPPLSQPDIVSVLVTGRTLEDVRGAEVNVAKEQALSYLSGGAAARVSRAAQETLGLSRVRIEPNLISPESDPGARLTLGQDITNFLRLIYSMNLADSRDQIYVAEWDVMRRFETRAIRQQDNSYRMEFRHDLRFGGDPAAARGAATKRAEQRVGQVTFEGERVLPGQAAEKKFGVKQGSRYDFFEVQKGIDKLESFYDKQDRLEARVRVEREVAAGVVDLKVTVDAGPEVDFTYAGMEPPGGLQKKVRRAWSEGLFDAQRADDTMRAIRAHLVEQGYLQCEIKYDVKAQPDGKKRVQFAIQAGPRYRIVELAFEGASGVSGDQLRDLLKSGKRTMEVHLDPQEVVDFLESYYAEQGYLRAEVSRPVYEFAPEKETAKLVMAVREGPQFKVGNLRLEGARALKEAQLLEPLALASGSGFRPEMVQTALGQLEEAYWSEGYSDVDIRYELRTQPEEGLVDVTFQIEENRKSIVESVRVEGNRETSDRFVLGQVELAAGDVLDFHRTAKSRRSLYDTGAYSLVDIQTQPVAPAPGLDYKPVSVGVKLREVRPFELRYGAYYDNERGPGFIADFANRNSLGSARVIGARTRYDSDLRELRGYFSQPLLRRLPMKTNVVGYTRREIYDTFITDRIGVSVQEEMRLRNTMILSYGYRLERTDTYDKDPDSFFKLPPFNLAPLTLSFTRETRDEFLDATRGSFMSHALEWAPGALFSDLKYAKYYGQYFKYVPLSKPAEIPWRGGRQRPRLVYAGGVRVGLGGGLGGLDLIPTERFFAGGGTTVRGFKQNTLGPVDFLGDPRGGNAVFITNQEIRFPAWRFFDGVGFLDAGNVYRTVAESRPWDLRASAGAGLRVRTPYFLLRFDYGLKLDRRQGESRGAFFFSIGQAF